jgi:hypothetical protein
MTKPMNKSSASGFGGGLLNFLGGALSGGLYEAPDLARGIQAYQMHKARKAYEQGIVNQHEAALAKQALETEKFDYEKGENRKKGKGNRTLAERFALIPKSLPSMDPNEDDGFYSDYIAPGNIQAAQQQFYNIMNSDATGSQIGKLQNQQPGQPTPPGSTPNPGAFQAGASYNEMVDPAEALMSQGAVNWGDVNTRLHNNQVDENTDFSNQTTRTHYEQMDANEKARLAAQNARDMAAASLDNRTNPNLRGGGGGSGPSRDDRLFEMYKRGEITKEQYLGEKAAGDQQYEALQENFTRTKQAFGDKDPRTQQAQNALRNHIQGVSPEMAAASMFNNPATRFLDRVSSGRGKAAFGNQSAAKMAKASQDLSRSIYPGK